MQDFKTAYGRYALAFATFATAVAIGFVMQTSEASVPGAEVDQATSVSNDNIRLPQDLPVPRLGNTAILPKMPKEQGIAVSLPKEPVLVAVADDTPVGLLPAESQAPRLGCESEMRAETAAGAMVDLHLSSLCHAGAPVLIQHADLQFQTLMPASGALTVSVPALREQAVFTAKFENGDRLTATTSVDSLSFYDRVVLQWHGGEGPELHAREFGAQYGDVGHVWRNAPRDISALADGAGGFLLRLNEDRAARGAKAEVYTFPSGVARSYGEIAMSIEAEITHANCEQELRMHSMVLRQGRITDSHAVSVQMPECATVGEFLLLKNLVEDLTIARN